MLDGSPTEVSTPRGRRAGATASLYFASSAVTMLLCAKYLSPDAHLHGVQSLSKVSHGMDQIIELDFDATELYVALDCTNSLFV